uniref:Carboxylesterase type B domain-containing protein n=1 Tax=Dendroctonus ponderosae TaxID=77166 RepID=A0AAR5PZ01_DENPD
MLNKILLILMLCLGYQISVATCEETVEITIPDGTIRGQVNSTVRENVTFYSFRGIPYAKPPVGNLRFASPVKNSAWSGVYNATYDRSECYQNSDGFLGFTFAGQEDCLYINVYTPDINASGLPVLVWIHGGSFLLSNSSYAQFRAIMCSGTSLNLWGLNTRAASTATLLGVNLGTGHAEDLSYYFVADSNYTATDLKVSETMVLLWSNFAKYGNPTPQEDEKFNNTIWEPIDSTDSDLIYLSFNESIVMATNPKEADWKYYERVYAKYGDDSDEITTY